VVNVGNGENKVQGDNSIFKYNHYFNENFEIIVSPPINSIQLYIYKDQKNDEMKSNFMQDSEFYKNLILVKSQ
jgi:hypothetical protein